MSCEPTWLCGVIAWALLVAGWCFGVVMIAIFRINAETHDEHERFPGC